MILNDIISQVSAFLSHDNDDIIDRFHYRYTVVGLAIYLVLITSKQYYGDPIVCLPPGGGNLGSAPAYYHSACWLKGTYRINMSESLQTQKFDSSTRITYYQWIIFILIGQCFLFMFPSVLWTFCNRLHGFDIVYISRNVVRKAYLAYYSNDRTWPSMQKMLQNVTDHLKIEVLKTPKVRASKDTIEDIDDDESAKKPFLKFVKIRNMTPNERATKRRNNPSIKSKSKFPLYLSYLGIKIVYLLAIVLQFVLLTWIFNFNYLKYGWDEGIRVLTGIDYDYNNIHFPKHSVCRMFHMGELINYSTILCSLPINLFNEIFYSALWIWSIILFILTLMSLIYWCALLSSRYRRNIVCNFMDIQFIHEDKPSTAFAPLFFGENVTSLAEENKVLIEQTGMTAEENFNLFLQHVCSWDVLLIIRLLAINNNPLVAKDLLTTLWFEYLNIDTYGKIDKNVQRRPDIPEAVSPIEFKTVNEQDREKPSKA